MHFKGVTMPLAARRRKRAHRLTIVGEKERGKVRFKLAGYYVDGKRVRKYFASREEAQTFVQAELIRRENLGNRATRIDGALAEDALRALDALKSTPYNLLDAARIVSDAHEKLSPHTVRIDEAINKHIADIERRNRSVTIAKLFEEFIENRRSKRKSEIYIKDLQTRLGRFTAAMGNRIVADLTTQDIDQWIQSLNVGPQTQNNFRAVLSSMWTFAVRRSYAPTNIITHVDKSQVVRDHIPVFSVEELTALLSAAPNEYLPILTIGAFAGLRPEELNKLQWQDIDLRERTIRVNASVSKTRKKRFAEISDNLAAWLQHYAGRTGRIGKVAPPNLQKLRRATMIAAKITAWPQDVLRHSFASAHYAHYKNPAHTALLLGHRDQTMLLNHYRDLMRPTDAARYWQIMPTGSSRKLILLPT